MLILILYRMCICDIFALTPILVITLKTAEVFLCNSVQDTTQSQTVAPALWAEQRQGGAGGGGSAAADGDVNNDDDDLSELLLLLCSGLSHPKAYPF